jgi:F-box domain
MTHSHHCDKYNSCSWAVNPLSPGQFTRHTCSQMSPLPPEVLEKVFAQLARRDLVSVSLTSRLCYHLSLIFLYRIILDIQLSGRNDGDDSPSLKCLNTISSPGNSPQTVRHFAARGHPWLQESTMNTLVRALFQVKELVSLELDLGSHPEERIFTESRSSDASFLPRLQAFSVHRHTSAVHLMKNRPVENARIRSKIDLATFLELLPALRRCTTSLTSLQISILVRDMVSAVSVMVHLSQELPSLRTLGITFIFPTPHWTERLSVSVYIRTIMAYTQLLTQPYR